jgi:hypothetical protein
MSLRPLEPRDVERLALDTGPWLSCDDCFALVDEYVERLLAADSGAMPLMRGHLLGCPACAEEAATLVVLAAEEAGVDPRPVLALIG